MNDKTKTVFRVDRTNVVFALFPEIESDTMGRYCLSYQHVGQHCSADYRGCVASSKPATRKQYTPLLKEIKGRGYDVQIIKRYVKR